MTGRAPPRPRVALVCADAGIPLLGCGGASSHLRGMAAGYVQAGADVHVWVTRFEPHAGAVAAPLPAGVRALQGPAGPGPFAAFVAAQARALGPQLIHERHALGGGAGRGARRPGIRWIVEVNAPLTWEGALFRGRRARRADLARELAPLPDADAVLAVSEPLVAWLATHSIAADLLPNAAWTVQSPPIRGQAGPFVLGFEGTFKPWHGLLDAVGSLDRLARAVAPRPLELELVGDGPERPALLTALTALRSVSARWLGERDAEALGGLRAGWDAAWSPRAPWPPPGAPIDRVAHALGEPLPDRWFAPLKEAEAAAAGLGLWTGDQLCAPAVPPRAWADVAAGLLAQVAAGQEVWDDARTND